MASDDARVLKAFLKAYPTGSAAERVRSRLRGLGSQQGKWTAASWQKMVVTVGLVVCVSGLLFLGIWRSNDVSDVISIYPIDMIDCDNNSGDQAIAACTRVINGGYRNPALLSRAYVKRASFDVDRKRALVDSNEAVKLDPNNALAYYSRGLAEFWLGENASGTADLAKAKSLDPNCIQVPRDVCDK
jgi:tetratricopeptide (TPR) repeat protein